MSRAAALAADLSRAGFGGTLTPECSLAPLTTWRIGGPAELLAAPRHREDLTIAMQWAASTGVPCRILGNGSNLLVDDAGVKGLVIRLRRVLDEIDLDDRVVVGAGASLPAVSKRCCAAGLAGLEFGGGIPGTMGGAVVMNAGWHEHETANVIESVEWLAPDGQPTRLDREACRFAYRNSRFRGAGGVVLAARLELVREDAGELTRRMTLFAESRKANQPTEYPSCGSVFLQPPGDFAGRLIDQAGLKGLRVGEIEVSTLHANFFINHGAGSSRDVLALVETVERKVFEHSGIKLEREFERWS